MKLQRCWPRWLAIFLLGAFFAQCVTSMVVKSPTVDEQAHLMRGYVYLERGEVPFKIGHPILANALNALPLWGLSDLSLPIDTPSWRETNWSLFADRLFWRPENDVHRLFLLGRLVTVALGMLFAAMVFRWASQLWGEWGGVLALALFAFDPTIIAHSRLTTDDVAVSFFYFASTYGLWRYLETNRKRDLVLTGLAFGLAQGCKFSALLLAPVLVSIVILWAFLCTADADHRRWLLNHALALAVIFAIGGLIIWATYRFELRSPPGWSLPVPATTYFEDLIWQKEYLRREGYVFLNGNYSASGWWYYFLVAFALKSPLPTMLLLGAAFNSLQRKIAWPRVTALLLPAMIYFLATLVVSVNIGYRFFIPVLPYLYVLGGKIARKDQYTKKASIVHKANLLLVTGALIGNAATAAWIFPHYLSYFNILAGGPDDGWRYLTDSNIDWGQDLPALRDLVQKQNLGRIKLAYFGTAHPSYYDIDFEPLPTWEPAPEQGNPFTKTYYPHQPAPGVYAISATLLQGVVMEPEQWDTYAWFRDKEPFAKAGYSIFLYRVEPTGPPADVALSGIQIDQLTPETFASFNTNDMRLRWFDAQTSFVIPDRPAWYVTSEANLASQGLEDTQNCTLDENVPCTLYPPDPEAHSAILKHIETTMADSETWFSSALVPSSEEQLSPLSLPANLDDQFRFLGYELEACNLKLTDCNLSTAWRITAPPDGPRAIFVHLLAPDGEVAAQWDGLDVPVKGWRVGDTILQKASFDLPSDLGPGQYWLQTGVYNPDTMKRLPMLTDGEPIANRVLLSPVEVDDQ